MSDIIIHAYETVEIKNYPLQTNVLLLLLLLLCVWCGVHMLYGWMRVEVRQQLCRIRSFFHIYADFGD